jgi:hypothetical protein
MTLKEQLMNDIKAAMKAGASDELTTLRGLSSVLKNAEIAKQMKAGASAVLTDEEGVNALLTEAKKRKDAMVAYQAASRPELVAKEQSELVLVQRYLPAQISAADAEKEIDRIIAESGVKEFGPLMKLAMASLRGKADGQMITDLIKKKLA